MRTYAGENSNTETGGGNTCNNSSSILCTEYGAEWRWYRTTSDSVPIPGYSKDTGKNFAQETTIEGCKDYGGYWRYAMVAQKSANNYPVTGQRTDIGSQVGATTIGDNSVAANSYSNYRSVFFNFNINSDLTKGRTYLGNYGGMKYRTDNWNTVAKIYHNLQNSHPGVFTNGWNGTSPLMWFCGEKDIVVPSPPEVRETVSVDTGSIISYINTLDEDVLNDLYNQGFKEFSFNHTGSDRTRTYTIPDSFDRDNADLSISFDHTVTYGSKSPESVRLDKKDSGNGSIYHEMFFTDSLSSQNASINLSPGQEATVCERVSSFAPLTYINNIAQSDSGSTPFDCIRIVFPERETPPPASTTYNYSAETTIYDASGNELKQQCTTPAWLSWLICASYKDPTIEAQSEGESVLITYEHILSSTNGGALSYSTLTYSNISGDSGTPKTAIYGSSYGSTVSISAPPSGETKHVCFSADFSPTSVTISEGMITGNGSSGSSAEKCVDITTKITQPTIEMYGAETTLESVEKDGTLLSPDAAGKFLISLGETVEVKFKYEITGSNDTYKGNLVQLTTQKNPTNGNFEETGASYKSIAYATFSVKITEDNKTICSSTKFSPTQVTITGGVATGNGTEGISHEDCARFKVETPTAHFQVWGGSIYATGDIKDGKNPSDGFGSWVDFGIISNGEVENVASGAAYNISGASGKKAHPMTISNVNTYNTYGESGVTKASTANALKNKFCPNGLSGDITISSASDIAFPICANAVIISANIEYPNNLSASNIPQNLIFAKNININSDVSRIDAWLIVEETIDTCNNGSECDENQLIINGPIFAKNIELKRIYGSSDQKPAEILDMGGITYLWAYNQALNSSKASTTHIRELAPRY